MSELSPCERELVALGAAIASNCLPCIEYHIPEARRQGLSDAQIGAAIDLAEQVKQVPAGNVLALARQCLGQSDAPANAPNSTPACCPADPASTPACC